MRKSTKISGGLRPPNPPLGGLPPLQTPPRRGIPATPYFWGTCGPRYRRACSSGCTSTDYLYLLVSCEVLLYIVPYLVLGSLTV